MPPYLIVPGWTNSGPQHWQSLWEAQLPGARRVEQRDWQRPDPVAWVAALDDAVRTADAAPVLIAHSLGCIAVARWAASRPAGAARAAYLVAPADVERPDTPPEIRPFAPIATARLPFPSMVVASSDDPYASIERSRALADAWGSTFADAGALGHINTASNLGEWRQGRQLLDALLSSAQQWRTS